MEIQKYVKRTENITLYRYSPLKDCVNIKSTKKVENGQLKTGQNTQLVTIHNDVMQI